MHSFEQILTGSKEKAEEMRQKQQQQQQQHQEPLSASDDANDETEEDGGGGEDLVAITTFTGAVGEWPAMDALQHRHLLCIAQMMRAILPHPNAAAANDITDDIMKAHDYLEHDPISPQEFLNLMQVYTSKPINS